MQKINRKPELDIRENGGNKEKAIANERGNQIYGYAPECSPVISRWNRSKSWKVWYRLDMNIYKGTRNDQEERRSSSQYYKWNKK